MKLYQSLLITLILVSTQLNAASITVLDTGDLPAPTTPYYSMSGLGFNNEQKLAVKFSLAQATSITSIQSFFNVPWYDSHITMAIYGDGGIFHDPYGYDHYVPDDSIELFSTAVHISNADASLPGYENDYGWFGTDNINWILDTGSYWLSYEVREGQTNDSYLPSRITDTATGITSYWPNPGIISFYNSENGTWLEYFGESVGVKITGETISPVPLPPALWLFISGFLILFNLRKKH